MSNERNLITDFSIYTTWLSTLEEISEQLWSKPISNGKWSVGEIIAHITNWDNHIISKIIPSVQKGKGMVFPEFYTFNKMAADYAKSGVSKSNIIEEAKNTRLRLVKELNELPTSMLTKPLPVNGLTHSPDTGVPYSLIEIVKEFIDHDNHHKGQIIRFLEESSLN